MRKLCLKTSTCTILLAGALSVHAEPLRDPAVLAKRIDVAIDKGLQNAKIPASASADDAEIMRRVYLDITGRIPTVEKTRAFLDSSDPGKRAKLIDELLASPDYGRHFAVTWRTLMIRPDANQIRPPDTKPIVEWLAKSFNDNRGWDAIVKDVLTSEGDAKSTPQGVYFILNGDSRGNPQANIIAGQTAQLFMGLQLQCAECHKHPFNKNWEQADFWGLAAFFGKVKLSGGAKGVVGAGITEDSTGAKGKNNAVAIKVEGTAIVVPMDAFQQVGKKMQAKVLSAAQPTLAADQPFRPAFADWLTSKENPYFARNAVNRLWAHFFGKGIVEIVSSESDMEGFAHADLLKELATEYASSGYDQKHLIRAICNSRVYQRSSQPLPGNKKDEELFSHMGLKVLNPEVLYDSLCQALEVKDLVSAKPMDAAKKKTAGLAPPNLTGRDQFVAFFTTKGAADDASEFSHGIPQALRLMNAELFNKGGSTVERASKVGSPEQAIEHLYLAALSRRPTSEELAEARAFAGKVQDPRMAFSGIFWALINGSEFTINH